MDDILMNKRQTILRCIARIEEEYNDDPLRLQNYTHQDAIMMNIQRLCEASLDMANHYIKKKKFGVPQNSRDAFALLEQHGVIDAMLSNRLQAMVGFRNVVVHDYQALHLPIVEKIISNYLHDGEDLADILLALPG